MDTAYMDLFCNTDWSVYFTSQSNVLGHKNLPFAAKLCTCYVTFYLKIISF